MKASLFIYFLFYIIFCNKLVQYVLISFIHENTINGEVDVNKKNYTEIPLLDNHF